jgi:hypothetical protein
MTITVEITVIIDKSFMFDGIQCLVQCFHRIDLNTPRAAYTGKFLKQKSRSESLPEGNDKGIPFQHS